MQLEKPVRPSLHLEGLVMELNPAYDVAGFFRSFCVEVHGSVVIVDDVSPTEMVPLQYLPPAGGYIKGASNFVNEYLAFRRQGLLISRQGSVVPEVAAAEAFVRKSPVVVVSDTDCRTDILKVGRTFIQASAEADENLIEEFENNVEWRPQCGELKGKTVILDGQRTYRPLPGCRVIVHAPRVDDLEGMRAMLNALRGVQVWSLSVKTVPELKELASTILYKKYRYQEQKLILTRTPPPLCHVYDQGVYKGVKEGIYMSDEEFRRVLEREGDVTVEQMEVFPTLDVSEEDFQRRLDGLVGWYAPTDPVVEVHHVPNKYQAVLDALGEGKHLVYGDVSKMEEALREKGYAVVKDGETRPMYATEAHLDLFNGNWTAVPASVRKWAKALTVSVILLSRECEVRVDCVHVLGLPLPRFNAPLHLYVEREEEPEYNRYASDQDRLNKLKGWLRAMAAPQACEVKLARCARKYRLGEDQYAYYTAEEGDAQAVFRAAEGGNKCGFMKAATLYDLSMNPVLPEIFFAGVRPQADGYYYEKRPDNLYNIYKTADSQEAVGRFARNGASVQYFDAASTPLSAHALKRLLKSV